MELTRKVSIIVPMYNSSDYIEELMSTLINQSYTNYEIIVVNDGSIDDSVPKVESFIQLYPHIDIFLYNSDNYGVSNARNIGIEHSTGEYLVFIDSDDLVSNRFLETMLSSMINCELSVVKLITFENSLKMEVKDTTTSNSLVTRNQFLTLMIENNEYGGFISNKLFKASIIKDNNLFFNTQFSMGEDMLFVINYLRYTEKVSLSNKYLYFYRQHSNNSSKNNHENEVKILNVYDEILVLDIINSNSLVRDTYIKSYLALLFYYYRQSKSEDLKCKIDVMDRREVKGIKNKIQYYLIKYKIY